MPFSPGADSWPPQDQLLSYHILEGRTNHTNLYLYHFKGYTQLLRSMLFCFVSFPAGSIYALVRRLCSLVQYTGSSVMAEGFHENIRPRDTLTRSHLRQQNTIVVLIGGVISKGSRNNT